MLCNHESYSVWKLKEYLESSNKDLFLQTVFIIPERGNRFLLEEIFIYNNFFYIIALDLDNIGIGNGTIEEFQIKGDAILRKNPDQSKDLRGILQSLCNE